MGVQEKKAENKLGLILYKQYNLLGHCLLRSYRVTKMLASGML